MGRGRYYWRFSHPSFGIRQGKVYYLVCYLQHPVCTSRAKLARATCLASPIRLISRRYRTYIAKNASGHAGIVVSSNIVLVPIGPSKPATSVLRCRAIFISFHSWVLAFENFVRRIWTIWSLKARTIIRRLCILKWLLDRGLVIRRRERNYVENIKQLRPPILKELHRQVDFNQNRGTDRK